MLSAESLGTLLLSFATADRELALSVVAASDELTAEERASLAEALRADGRPVDRARGLGDALRSREAPGDLVNECYRAAFYLGDGVAELLEDPLFAYVSANRAGRPLARWAHTL